MPTVESHPPVTSENGLAPDLQEAVERVLVLVRAWTAHATPALVWGVPHVVDRHGFSEIPGRCTTPIVAAIMAAAGATMPHFSLSATPVAWSTADVMASLTGVELDRRTAASIASRLGVCIGRATVAGVVGIESMGVTADDAHRVASVLSRRLAAGVDHLLVSLDVAPGSSTADDAGFHRLQAVLIAVGAAIGVKVRVVRSVGSQPAGWGIGPVPEALDVLAVLRGAAAAPMALRMRALTEAGHLLELCGRSRPGHGEIDAWRLLDNGLAWARFQALCEAQGGLREPTLASHTLTIQADRAGHVAVLDANHLKRVLILAGLDQDPGVGAFINVRLGDRVSRGEPMATVHAASTARLAAVADELKRVPLVALT